MNNITEGPSLVTCLTEEGTHLPLNRDESLIAADTVLTPLNDDAVKATDNVGLSAGIKLIEHCDSGRDVHAETTLMDRRDLAGILSTREGKEVELVPAQLKMPLNPLGQITQPPLFQPQWSRRFFRQFFHKRRMKLFNLYNRPQFKKRLRSLSNHGYLRWKLRRLLRFLQMCRLTRWALRILALRAIFWNSWRQHSRRHQPAPSGADAARSSGAADTGLITVLAILCLLFVQVCWDMALGHLKAHGCNIVLCCGYLASAASEGGVCSGFFMDTDVALSKCNGLTLLAQTFVLFLSVRTALLLTDLCVPRNLSLLAVGQCLQSYTLIRTDSPFGHVLCCFSTLVLHLTYQIGLEVGFLLYHSIGLGATVWTLFVPYITSACWAFGCGPGRTVILDFIPNLTGPPQGFAPLSLVTSVLYSLILLGCSRVLCYWAFISSSIQARLNNAPYPEAPTVGRLPLLHALAALSLAEILQGNRVRTLDDAAVCARRLEHELPRLLQQATSLGCEDPVSSDGLVAAWLLREVLRVSALQDRILITADSYPSGDPLKSAVIRAVHRLTPKLSHLEARLSAMVDLHTRHDAVNPTASFPVDSPAAPLEPPLQASHAVGGLSADTPQLMLTWNNRRQTSLLRGLSIYSSCVEVYAKVGLDPVQSGGCFYVQCNGSRLPFSHVPLSTFLVGGFGELLLIGVLRGAGGDDVRATDPTPHTLIPEELVTAGRVALLPAAERPIRRYPQRQRRGPHHTPNLPPNYVPVYELGEVSADFKEDLEELVRTLNRSVKCQLYCAGIRAANQHYLCELHEPGKGTGLQVIRPIPGGTVLSYYSGIVTDQYTGGNHCLKLRQWGAHVAYLDGARRIPSAELHSTPMQLVNHKCEENSNCSARVVDFDDDPGGLGLLVLEAKHDLAAGVFLSFDYRGDFFHRHVPGSVTPPGYKRVRCSCGKNAVCPNDLERFEKAVDQLFLSSSSSAHNEACRPSDRPRRRASNAALPGTVSTSSLGAGKLGVKRVSETDSAGQNRGTARRTFETSVQNRSTSHGCSEVVVPSTHCLGNDLEGLSATTLAGMARVMHPKAKVGQSEDPPTVTADQDLSCPTLKKISEGTSATGGVEALGSAGPVAAGNNSDHADQFCSVLTFRQLDGPQTPCLGRTVAEQPYGHLCGRASVCWQGTTYSVAINDEVRAVRGEGSCYLLSIADAVRNADSYPEFKARRLRHPALQGAFNECWNTLLGVSEDRDADGLRCIVYSHLLSNMERFRHRFSSALPTEVSDCVVLLREREAQFDLPGPPCLVRKWAFLFLRSSTHVDDCFMSVLLDWLGHRVGVMNLIRVTREQDDTTQFLHVPTADLIPDTAVLLIKVLNIEHQGRSRIGLNHFDRVSRGCPVQFLDEILVPSQPALEGSSILDATLSDKAGTNRNVTNQKRHGLDHGSTKGDCSDFCVPHTLLQAEEVLRKFDISIVWGPSQSLSRAERLHRRRALAADPPGWDWVDAVLRAFPVLAQLRPGQHPDPPAPPPRCNAQRVLVSCAPGRRSVQRMKLTAPAKDPKQRTLRDVWTQSVSASRKSTLSVVTEVSADVVDGHPTLRADTGVNPRPGVDLDIQSPHLMVPTRQKPLLFRLTSIPDPRVVPGLKSWIPGTQGLYPRFAPVATAGDCARHFPVWNVHVAGMRRQQAMFHLADGIEAGAPAHPVFYVAADVWSADKKGWSVAKVYGAFRDPVQFASQVLMGVHRAPTRCFYELIREGRPCKAYFDLEVEPGVMDARGGELMCQQVTKEWACRVRRRWPLAENQCPRCLEVMILDGSRPANGGWKVSYHLVYPWLTFPCNNTVLKDEVTALSDLPQFKYTLPDGTVKRFIDPSVYSRNRQFRMALSHKLSDPTQTPMRLPGGPSLSAFLLSCITRIELHSWRVPVEVSEDKSSSWPPARDQMQGAQSRRSGHRPSASINVMPLQQSVLASLQHLLRRNGLPEGNLVLMTGNVQSASLRWGTSNGVKWPCSVAQIWRPADPAHDGNGGIVSFDRTRAVFLKCLHPECQRLSKGRGVFLGYVPHYGNSDASSHLDSSRTPGGPRGVKRPAPDSFACHERSMNDRKRLAMRRIQILGSPAHAEGSALDQESPGLADSQLHSRNNLQPTEQALAEGHAPEVQPPPVAGFTRHQSLRHVYSKNRSSEQPSFEAWHVVSGAWGGRVGALDDTSQCATKHGALAASGGVVSEVAEDRSSSPGMDPVGDSVVHVEQTESLLRDWAMESCEAPFQVPPPDSLISPLREALENTNNAFSTECGGTLPAWDTLPERVPTSAPAPAGKVDEVDPCWVVQPPLAWHEDPLGRRGLIGHDLVGRALEQARPAETGSEKQSLIEPPNIWSSPFKVAFISVGFRRFRHSLPGVIEIVKQHRLDLLFLGDLGTTCRQIGKLRLQLQAELDDEWILLADICKSAGYPVGSGAMVHVSAVKHIQHLELTCPPHLDKENWSKAVKGRILLLELARPETDGAIWFVGLNQHVASSSNFHAREMVLATIEHLALEIQTRGGRLVVLGDVNAAPEGGRWGYSRYTKTRMADAQTDKWFSRTGLREIASIPLKATWKACLLPRKATLDRAWVYPADLSISDLHVQWPDDQPVFDHAMIMLSLPHTVAGMGFAGACRPLHQPTSVPRCRVNIKMLREPEILAEWQRLLHLSLTTESPVDPSSSLKAFGEHDQPLDPFQALKHAETVADRIAQSLAPCRVRRPGELCQSYRFGGHRVIFREMNVIRAARAFVHKILKHSTDILKCPHRDVLWTSTMSRLNERIARSQHFCPLPLRGSPGFYFEDRANAVLARWMDQAKLALDVRWATVREDFTKARFKNIKKAQAKLIRSGGVLDKQLLHSALGKRQPRPRMWGISGAAELGVCFCTSHTRHPELLEFLSLMPEMAAAVSIEGRRESLNIWFRGPRALGDFLIRWCGQAPPFGDVAIRTLAPPTTYVAIVPDDMLAVQELHLAREGMDSESICCNCRSPVVQPIVTTASSQKCGNSRRAVRFFCRQCCSVNDDVELAPLPLCPIPWNVWTNMRKIPEGSPPLICHDISYDTLEACVRRLPNGKSPGCDGIPREFYKYGPMILLEHLRSAINAYTKGHRPSEFAHEWEGSIVSLIPKTPAAMTMTDERPIACECSKYIIATTIYNDRLSRVMEDCQLLDDAQEGFRRHRNTKRQISKLQGLLAQQCRDKSQSVVLFLDIKNAFNAVNHRAIFSLLEAYGFHKVDVDFFRRMYSGKFLSVVNTFGESAACFLRRGVFQGDTPSPNIFNLALDPTHKMVRASGRGCLAPGMDGPSGSSGFADDTALHTSGSDAIPAMRALVNKIGPLFKWLGMSLNMSKSYISAINFATGRAIPTDSITFDGKPFSVLPPDQAHKHLGIRMTLTGDFRVEKDYVRAEMHRRIKDLMEDKVLPPSLKELAIKIGVISVFRYSAGVVPWTRTELDTITDMWIRAYKQAWFKAAARGMDSSPFVLNNNAGGRQCPSAIEVWMRDVLDTLDQCMTLPCEIAQFILFHLRQECCDHGCIALNQMQSLLRITGNAGSESLLKLLLLRLDEQGLEVSTPWAPQAGLLIAEILWPKLWCAWRAKEASSLIDHRAPLFSSGEAHATWEQAKQCLLALSKLGQVGIFMVSELRGQSGQWLSLSDVRLRSSHVTASEYQTLRIWLDQAPAPPAISVESTLEADRGTSPMHFPHHRSASDRSKGSRPSASRVTLPPCVRGRARSIQSHDRVQLECIYESARDALCKISDHDLAVAMCQVRSIFSFSTDESTTIQVECLVPLRALCPSATCPESIVVQDISAERFANQFTVLTMAFVRDSLVAVGAEYVRDACCRPPWLVPKEELQRWFTIHLHPGCPLSTSHWILGEKDKDGQQVLGSSVSSLHLRRIAVACRFPVLLHPWQSDPKLPDLVRFNLSNHYIEYLLSPIGWTVGKRNARVIITSPSQDVAGMDAAQYSMLADPHGTGRAPTEAVLKSIFTSYLSQLVADGEYHVPWSRHLLSCLHRILEVDLLIGARAVTTIPQFLYFSSPEPQDYLLGAVPRWPPTPALLLLDSIAPENRPGVLEQAASHGSVVWILRQDRPSPEAVADLAKIRSLRACLMAILPPQSMVLHDIHGWSTAKWDSEPSRYASQIWLLCSPAVQNKPHPEPCSLQLLLGHWENRRYDFYQPMEHPPPRLLRYRAGQQDAPFYMGQGLFAGSDGSVNYQKEHMGAGYVVTHGMDLAPIHRFSAPVGGPLASIRSEAVGLLCLLKWLRDNHLGSVPVTIFIDCLSLLQILSNWGRVDFWPGPKDIIHFDVLLPLLQVLREWTAELVLVKVKSHAGCYHNEMADDCADAGCVLDDPPLFSGPQKYGTLHLRLQPSLHTLVEKEHLCSTLPRDGAPNASILRHVVSVNTQRAMYLRNTIFVREVMYRPESAIVARVIVKSSDSEVRCWMQAMTGTYPVASYLHKIGKAVSMLCQHCSSGANETLSHFLSVCPRFHDARTAAHNQIRARLSSSVKRHLPSTWKLYEEAAMLRTGLRMRPVSSVRVRETGRLISDADLEAGRMSLSRWQPDLVAVSFKAKKIAILEVCRPSDTSPGQLQAAYERKMNLYGPLVEALGHYNDSGWSVKILPWVVGARGMVQERAMYHALEFIEVPKTFWRPIIEDTVLASISALAFMHRIRFSPPAHVQLSKATNPGLQINSVDGFLQCGTKRKNDCMYEGLDTVMERWRRIVATPQVQRGASGNADTTT